MPENKLKINYGSQVASIPFAALSSFDKATKKDIKILIGLCSLGGACRDEKAAKGSVSAELGFTEEDVANAIAFWRGAGIIEVEAAEDAVGASAARRESDKKAEEKVTLATPSATAKSLRHADELPRYTTEELAGILDKRSELSNLIDTCQQLYGKVFNTSEINILIGLADYLGFDSEYILLLFAHVGKLERKSVRTVEKLAFKFADEDITDADTLREHLNFLERSQELEGKIRTAFGISSRALTGKERKLVQKWLGEYKFGFDIIERAYELTVDSTQKPSIPYAGAILDRWHSEGIDTVEKIDAEIAAKSRERSSDGGSFDTDEFLSAALKRGYGEG